MSNKIPSFLKSTQAYGLLGLVSWVLFVFIEFVRSYVTLEHYEITKLNLLDNIVFSTFCISVFVFFKFEIEGKNYNNYTELLWKSLVTSIVSLLVLIFTKLILWVFADTNSQYLWLENTLYFFNVSLLIVMLCNTFFIFKKLSLYLKTKYIDTFWRYLGWAISLSTLCNVFGFLSTDKVFIILFVIFTIAFTFASFHIKWVAFFNYKQKIFSIFNLFLITIISLVFLEYFYDKSKHAINLVMDVTNNVFIMSMLSFSILYPVFSILVLLFNLPTSSVFENKLEEIKNLQKISKDAQSAKKETELYESLLVGAFSSINANFSALLITDSSGSIIFYDSIGLNLTKEYVLEIKSFLRKNGFKTDDGTQYVSSVAELQSADFLKKEKIRSLLWIPLTASNENIGYLVIGSNIKDAFENDGIRIIETYASQSSLSISYARLIEEKVKNERYKTALSIAEKVQRKLLPTELLTHENFEVAAYYKTAEEVGGDYYDFYKISETQYAILIADVSGKGTSAAFYTAQLKGVFMTLSNFGLDIETVAIKMNEVLKECLDRKSFVTVTILHIDTLLQKITQVRAGHCPTLFYNNKLQETSFINSKGLGLGLVKTELFQKNLEKIEIDFSEGDTLILYTDGLSEAKNSENEEFGFEKLNQIFNSSVNDNARGVIRTVVAHLHQFVGSDTTQDDCTILVVKFK